ncbi:MAG: copper resistance protein B [Pseudomonadota bacterium]
MHNTRNAMRQRLGALLIAALLPAAAQAQETAAEATGTQVPPVMDDAIYSFILIDQLEHQWNQGANSIYWDAQGWVGRDYHKLWIKTEGQSRAARARGEAEVQALYSRLIAPYWDFQAGVRYDTRFGRDDNPSRTFLVVGLQGLAPYWFDVEPALFLSDKGELSARLTAEYDLLFTQRLVLQPRLEVNASARRVEDFELGSGVNNMELGLRLRYEIRREFAPYIGVSWDRKFGGTADFARRAGEEVDNTALVAGLRVWY